MSKEKPRAKAPKPAKNKKSTEKPEKEPLEKELQGYEALGLPEPTRYGDWEVKGRCSDF